MSMQMLKTKIKSLGTRPLGDTESELRRQLAGIEQPKPKPRKKKARKKKARKNGKTKS